jgi:hypothetical protein
MPSHLRTTVTFATLLAIAGCGDKPAIDLHLPRETWDAFYMQGSKVGYGHMRESLRTEGGQQLVEAEGEIKLVVRRFGQDSEMNVSIKSLERPDGSLVSFESSATLGPTPQVAKGEVRDGRLWVDLGGGRKTDIKLDPNVPLGGINAVDDSLLRKPMQPGETRHVLSLWPIVNQPAANTLVARDYEKTELLTGAYELLRIDVVTRLAAAPETISTLWVDRSGEVLKNRTDSLDQIAYRVTPEIALDQTNASTFDIGTETLVKTPKPSSNPHQARLVIYKVAIENGDPAGIFPEGLSQQVDSLGPHEAEVAVFAIRPDTPVDSDWTPDVPSPDDRKPSALVQSDDPLVTEMAAKAAGDEKDPWRMAVRLEKYVHETIDEKNFSQALASAAEVAASHEGDCTEHAVLLAALARARGLPARVAIGLVYMPKAGTFGFHMWTEIYIVDRWVPMDATLGLGGIGGGHLKIGHSSLTNGEGLASFLMVAPVLGRLKIDSIEIEK